MNDKAVLIKQATKLGYAECAVGGVADFSFPSSKTRRGRVQEKGNVCPTITSQSMEIHKIESVMRGGNSDMEKRYRIRKLTPKECWRLMDFHDSDFKKAAQVNSNTQLYRQAGNSIVCNVLVAIIGQMISGKENIYAERSRRNEQSTEENE